VKSSSIGTSVAIAAAVATALLLSACSFESKDEKLADSVTRAIMNNNLAPVQDQIEKGVDVPRIKIAAWADELDAQGKLLSVKEVTPCDPGVHCFTVKFEKHTYDEKLALDENGKITHFNFHMADADR
jgi:outer membrane murein-binding lipoprotein Lpp